MENERASDAEPPAAPPPTEATLLSELPVTALDTETTGLDPGQDRIVAIGAVRLHGRRLYPSSTFDTLVRPGISIPASSSAIHGISDAMVAGAPDMVEIWPRLRPWLTDKAVLGHHIDFDLAMIGASARRHGLSWTEPFALDTARLAGALDGSSPVDLDEAARRHGVAIEGRHSALGDSLIAARLWLQLVPRLVERGVVTLGDAIRFQAQNAAPLRNFQQPASHPTLGDQPALRRLDAFPYLHRIADVMSRPLLTIEPHRTLREAASVLAERGVSALVSLDGQQRPAGIMTERDVVRAVAGGGEGALASTVATILSSPVTTVAEADFVHVAIGRLDRLGFRHLVVVDGEGRAAGMVTSRSLLRQRSATALLLGDQIQDASDAGGLSEARAKLPGLAQALIGERIPALDIAAVMSAVLRDMTRRATEIAVSAMAEEGRGAAPAPWSMLVLGSGGRGESLLGPDQDNAIVHLGSEADDAWFAELGQRVADILDGAGIPYCRGGVMAREPGWRHALDRWTSVIEGWAAAASPEDALAADIFFDFAGVAGDMALAERLRRLALDAVAASPMLLQRLAVDLARTTAPLGLFGGLRTEAGRVDLKLNGLLPIVGFARALALRHRIGDTSTPARLRKLVESGHVADADFGMLVDAHQLLVRLILEQQVVDTVAGRALSNRVEVGRLDRRLQSRLKKAFKDIEVLARGIGGGLS